MTTANQAAKPLLAVKYPFVTEDGKEFSDLEKLLTDLSQQSGGYYLLGANNCWHGGIHITDEKFAHHKTTHPVRCMMDGVVIAYRLNKNYPTQKWQVNSTQPATDLKFSNGFCLIKHEYESPANQTEDENKGKTNKLTFYSLYMHLADYQTYVPDSANKEKTVTITKDTNARDIANINHKLGELTSGSTIKVDAQQQPYKAKINGKFYKYYRGTVVSKAANSAESIAVGALVYLYASCFPAGAFSVSEKPTFPGYWKATVTGKSKEPMAVYSSEQTCRERKEKAIARLNPEQAVIFHSEQITYATIKGKSLKIALCEFPASSTFGSGPETNLKSGWMIVDESQVSWEKVEPTDFDHIVKLSKPLPISAGDSVGFMGIWESPEDPIAAGTTKTKYQMHVELFTANDKTALDQFLNNDAKLTSGKKYLKMPKGTQLYASNGHGNYVYVHESLFAARDYVFAESDCTQVKDTVGTIFYQLKQIRTGEAALGPVDNYYVKIEGSVKLVTQYDWNELGFSTLEETNDDADGYINPEKIPSALFKDIFKRVDGINSRNGHGDGALTGDEIKAALQQDKDLRNDLYKIIAGHPSEWHNTTQDSIKKLFEEIKAKNTEEEYKNATQFEIDRFLKCEFISQIDGLTQKLWHFHPVIFCSSIKQHVGVINAGQITYDAEGNNDSNSLYFSRVIHWPGNAESGVTIGRGYDLGNRSESEIIDHLTESGVASEQANKIAKAAGKKGSDARDFVKNNKDDIKEITLDNQINLFNLIYPKYIERTISNYNHYTSDYVGRVEWDLLDKAVKEILVDFVYQGFTKGPKPMVSGMKNSKTDLIGYIKNSPIMMGYENGRHRVKYLENN